jgi:hypothetical protein
MKSKESAKSKKQSVVVKDLNAKKDPKGGSVKAVYEVVNTNPSRSNAQPVSNISDQAAGGILTSY